MAIRVITGKPGGGKSYYALREIVDELVYGCRVVVTNLPLKLPELNAYLQRKYPKPELYVDLADRVRMLSEEDTKFFFAHRAHGCDFVVPDAFETKAGKHVDYGDISKLRPVFYVIDEAHICFDARAWMSSGPHLTYYNSQHRKPGDEVFFVTQFVALLDKRCSGFAQEFIECRNFGMERLSVFRGPKGQHQARHTLTPPNGDSVPAVHNPLFRLDKEVAECYDTTSGVGISGRSGAPREKQIKGWPPYYAIIGAACFIAAVYYATDLVSYMLDKGTSQAQKVVTSAGNAANAKATPSTARNISAPEPQSHGPDVPAVNPPSYAAPVVVYPVVVGVMRGSTGDLIACQGYGWSKAVTSLPGGLIELENGLVVRAGDVRNPRGADRPISPVATVMTAGRSL